MRRSARRWRARLLLLAPAVAPPLAWASEAAGEAARSPGFDLVMKVVNFGILAGILFYFLRKPLSQSLADRQQSIRNELEEALKAKRAAEAKYEDVKRRVAGLEEEIRGIQESFRLEGERQRERIAKEAARAAEAVRQQAQTAGSHELKRALDELRVEAAELAVRLATEKLANAYTPEDQKQSLQTTIQRIEREH